MPDQTSNDRAQAAMKQKETFLTSNGGKGQTPCSPRQAPVTNRPTRHVEVGTGKRL